MTPRISYVTLVIMATQKGNSGHTVAQPKILRCNCKHPFQDSRYGDGMRVFNPRTNKKFACTVCGRITDV